MGKDHYRKKEKTNLPKYVRHFEWFLACPAYRSLGVYARALYTELARRYNGSNNGGISLSHREAQELLNCSNKPVKDAFDELQAKGFIKISQRGSFDWKAKRDGSGNGRATTWLLTEFAIDLPQRVPDVPTRDFQRWSPSPAPSPSKKKPVCPERTNGGTRSHYDPEMVCPEHTNGVIKAYDKGQSAPHNGMPSSHTYSIPDTLLGDGALTPLGGAVSDILNAARDRLPTKRQGGQRAGTA